MCFTSMWNCQRPLKLEGYSDLGNHSHIVHVRIMDLHICTATWHTCRNVLLVALFKFGNYFHIVIDQRSSQVVNSKCGVQSMYTVSLFRWSHIIVVRSSTWAAFSTFGPRDRAAWLIIRSSTWDWLMEYDHHLGSSLLYKHIFKV